jgi:hypothetical protein
MWSVYNLLDSEFIDALIAAYSADVSVKVLIHCEQLAEPYVPTWKDFEKAGLNVLPLDITNRNATVQQLKTANLVGIDNGECVLMGGLQ